MTPTLTVYITNYNYAAFIKQAVQSVLDQSFQDYEILILDDGSTDNSKEIIQEYEKLDKVTAVFQNNIGLNRSNNVALKMARGKYIMRLDADDYLVPTALKKMVQKLEENPKLALVFPDYYNVDESGNILNQYQRIDFSDDNLVLDRPPHGAVTMVRKSVLESVGGYNENYVCQDGYDLWLKIHTKFEVANINEPLFYYRAHGGNLTGDKHRLYQTRAKMMDEHTKANQLPLPKVVAIIPVRGNALDPRSLPLKKLGNKTLIEWTIDAAMDANYIDKVVLSTPDENLSQFIEEKYKGEVLILSREKDLARINTSISDTLKSASKKLDDMNVDHDALMTLYIESPFREASYIDQAINHMRIYNTDAVDAVAEDNNFIYRHQGNGLEPIRKMSFLQLERDDIFRRCGGLHLVTKELLQNKDDLWDAKVGHIVLDQKAGFMVRSQLDFEVASFLAEKK